MATGMTPSEVIEDRERWKAAVPHEGRPGQTAVSEADRDLLVRKPGEIRELLAGSGASGDQH